MRGALLAALVGAFAPSKGDEGVVVALGKDVVGLALLDWNGDGAQELLVAREDGVEIATLEADGSLAPMGKVERGAARTLAWCLEPPAANGAKARALLTLRDDGVVQRHAHGAAPFDVAKLAALALPSGVFPFPFARDLDGDGDADLALPAPGGLKLWFVGADGKATAGPMVRHRVETTLDVPEAGDDGPEVGVTLSIPGFEAKDQNGDGKPDLVFESEDHLTFFWTGAAGALPAAPTVDVDLGELRAKLKPSEGGILDPANLFKALASLVNAEVRDFDGDHHADLLLRQGSKVSLFAGTATGIDRAKAAQVLKVSGNLLDAFAFDDNGDGKEDLCLLQVADVSIGQVLLWVIVGGKLEFDLFTYHQEGSLRFSRSPSRRRRLIVDLPALLGLVDDFKETPAVVRLADEFARQPIGVDLDGDGQRGDVALLKRDGTIAIHRGAKALPEAYDPTYTALRRLLVQRFDAAAKGEEQYSIDLLDLVEWAPTPGSALRAAVAGKTPAAILAKPDPSADRPDKDKADQQTDRLLIAADLDGDGKDDLLLLDREPMELRVFRTR